MAKKDGRNDSLREEEEEERYDDFEKNPVDEIL